MAAAPESLEERVEQLEALLGLAHKLLRAESYFEVLDVVVEDSLEILRADRGFLVVPRREDLEFRVARNWSRGEIDEEDEAISGTIVREVLERRQPILIRDALGDRRFAKAESVVGQRIRSVMAAPLEVDRDQAGVLYLEGGAGGELFGRSDFDLFQRILEISARALASGARRLVLEQQTRLLKKEFLARFRFPGIVTRDRGFLKVLETVGQVADSELPVLVQGESGTGKELVVRALHLNSPRSDHPLVTVNCGAISPSLLESELFGHLKGAFTGATRQKQGMVRAADGGTLFLDEIGELRQELQVKLLRTLQFGEVQPVGSEKPVRADVRVLAATNRDLEEDVHAGRFREDLLYRLNAITIALPPLRSRPDDVLPLFYHFLQEAAEEESKPLPDLSPRLERALRAHDWPGNVRELKNEARRLMAVAPAGAPLTLEILSPRIAGLDEAAAAPGSLAEKERELIELHLRLSGGNRTRAAQSLGISREGLRKKMKRFKLA